MLLTLLYSFILGSSIGSYDLFVRSKKTSKVSSNLVRTAYKILICSIVFGFVLSTYVFQNVIFSYLGFIFVFSLYINMGAIIEYSNTSPKVTNSDEAFYKIFTTFVLLFYILTALLLLLNIPYSYIDLY